MKYINKIPLALICMFSLLIGVTFFTFLNFFDILSNRITDIMIYILFFSLIFLYNFKIVKKSKKKGLIIGIVNSSIIMTILTLLKIIFKISFKWLNLLYGLSIFFTSIVGGIIGANTKKSSNF